jgi:hypothetical protein
MDGKAAVEVLELGGSSCQVGCLGRFESEEQRFLAAVFAADCGA